MLAKGDALKIDFVPRQVSAVGRYAELCIATQSCPLLTDLDCSKADIDERNIVDHLKPNRFGTARSAPDTLAH